MTTAIIIVAVIIGQIWYRLLSIKPAKKRTEIVATTLTIQEFIDKYNKKQGLVKGGSLCFFGHWFGKPYDNYHQLEFATYDNSTNSLTMTFGEKETLTIFNPQDICEIENQLTIGSADKINWKWYYYGKPQTVDNQYFIEIIKQDSFLTGKTNSNWHKEDFKDLNIKCPALLWS